MHRWYFAYGSNMSSQRLAARIGIPTRAAPARLVEYRHTFSMPGSDGTGKGNVEPAAGDLVWGVLYLITADQLIVLDDYESGYERREVAIDGLDVAIYVARQTRAGLQPSEEYLVHYERGIREHGIPLDYWDRIRRF